MDMRKSGLVSSSDSGSYSDLNRLNQLKVGDKNSDGNMRKVAQEFESLFLGEMLKSMRSATEALGQDNPLNTPAAKQYQEMYDQQLAVSMSREGGGIGLADVLMRQMSKNKPMAPGEAAAASAAKQEAAKVAAQTPVAAGTVATGGPLSRVNGQRPLWASRSVHAPTGEGAHRNDMAMINQRRLALPPKLADRLLAGLVPSASTTAATAATVQNKIQLPQSTRSGSGPLYNGDWLASQTDTASGGGMQIYGRAMAQIPLAPAKKAFSSAGRICRHHAADGQGGCGAHWYRSEVPGGPGRPGNRLGQIGDARRRWQQQSQPVRHQGRPAVGRAVRRGRSPANSAMARWSGKRPSSVPTIPTRTASTTLVTLLQTNNRYQEVVKSADNPEQFVRELQKAGYATDPDYASKISQIAKADDELPELRCGGRFNEFIRSEP